jgi:hypothetical protein
MRSARSPDLGTRPCGHPARHRPAHLDQRESDLPESAAAWRPTRWLCPCRWRGTTWSNGPGRFPQSRPARLRPRHLRTVRSALATARAMAALFQSGCSWARSIFARASGCPQSGMVSGHRHRSRSGPWCCGTGCADRIPLPASLETAILPRCGRTDRGFSPKDRRGTGPGDGERETCLASARARPAAGRQPGGCRPRRGPRHRGARGGSVLAGASVRRAA